MNNTISNKIIKINEKTSSFSTKYDDLNENIVALYASKIFFKTYPRFDKVKLPKPEELNVNLFEALKNRKTQRDFSRGDNLTVNELSNLLYFSFSIKQEKINDYNLSTRFYPSAGAKYPIEAYIYLNREINKNLKKGLYHYNVKEHLLESMNCELSDEVMDNINPQKLIKDAPVTIFLTAAFNRTVNKYGARGYRFLHLDCGHLSQNICLISSAFNLKLCLFGGFDDNLVSQILEINGNEEFPCYILSIGK